MTNYTTTPNWDKYIEWDEVGVYGRWIVINIVSGEIHSSYGFHGEMDSDAELGAWERANAKWQLLIHLTPVEDDPKIDNPFLKPVDLSSNPEYEAAWKSDRKPLRSSLRKMA